jgi:hypothetical protein
VQPLLAEDRGTRVLPEAKCYHRAQRFAFTLNSCRGNVVRLEFFGGS